MSPEMALRLGRFFGNGTEVWMRMQTAYDRWTVKNDPMRSGPPRESSR